MTTVTFILDGPRGAKYRLIAEQLGADVGGGIFWHIQKQGVEKNGQRNFTWVDVAGAREDTNCPASRILAGWLTSPMPPKEDFKADKAAVKDYNA